MKKRIFLVGPMAAGKSTIGKQLAKALDYDWIDTDQEIVRRTGVDVHWIFDQEGEAGFRKRESELVDELTLIDNLVVSTGAGAILAAENRENLSQRGIVIYLKVSISKQLQRTLNDRVRPLLQTDNKQQKLIELAEQRNKLYTSIADIELLTDKSGVGILVQQLEQKLRDLPI